MAKFIASVKAVITRLVFGLHGFVAIWQVSSFKRNPIFWYLCSPIVLLFFEGIFTLTIKANQEWKWFCPSVFLYLGSVVPAIWLLELDKVERRLLHSPSSNVQLNDTLLGLGSVEELKRALGLVNMPEIQISRETWVTLIEQFLMLILIVGRWMLPKGELTRDQLSQLLLVYIGTAADIIEFFDSFKEERVARERLLVYLTLGIWSWSLLQFTVVLTATKSRKSRLSASAASCKQQRAPSEPTAQASCCSIDVWAIAINMLLQDAPFLAFRLILIVHYEIVSYMNIFFTCKNTLVILLQLYRLYVLQSEAGQQQQQQQPHPRSRRPAPRLSLVSYGLSPPPRRKRRLHGERAERSPRPERKKARRPPERRRDQRQASRPASEPSDSEPAERGLQRYDDLESGSRRCNSGGPQRAAQRARGHSRAQRPPSSLSSAHHSSSPPDTDSPFEYRRAKRRASSRD